MKQKNDKLDLVKIKKKMFTVKTHMKKLKRPAIGWEKVFASYLSDKFLPSRTCKEFSIFNNKIIQILSC